MVTDPPAISLSWQDIATTVTRLATSIKATGRPQMIVGILRGGMIPAVLLAHRLAIRDVHALPIVRTTADGPNAPKYDQPRVSSQVGLPSLRGRDVLVIDDVVGSGKTMSTARRLVTQHGASRVRTAVCVVNSAGALPPVTPHGEINFIGSLYNRWVVFPWETP